MPNEKWRHTAPTDLLLSPHTHVPLRKPLTFYVTLPVVTPWWTAPSSAHFILEKCKEFLDKERNKK